MSSLPIQDLARLARDTGASDLYLSEGAPARLKTHGGMEEVVGSLVTRAMLVEFWQACGENPETTCDADAAWYGPMGTRFRVNLNRHLGKLGAVLRQIRTQIPTMEALGLPEALLTSWVQRRSGLVLVTGPTGCGKSTTIASCLEAINTSRGTHIVTIEDPVEFVFEDRMSFFTQREVGLDTADFAGGLRQALRQAPDVIFVGEIRDAETALIALQASETGHVVFSTLHSPNVVETVDRLAHMVPAGDRDSVLSLLSMQTIGILSQRLLPREDGAGVTLVCEHLEVAGAARDWLRKMDVAALQEYMRRGENPNNCSYQEALVRACQDGRISYETALANAANQHDFNRSLRGIS